MPHKFIAARWRDYGFLFTELVKRDFKKKYRRTVLGILWSLLGPLLDLLVMALVFTRFFGRDTPHYIVYLFSGRLVFAFFKESTNGGMTALSGNGGIIKALKVPKYIFLLTKNVSTVVNFLLTLLVYFLFVAADSGLHFSPRFFLLIIPVLNLMLFNIGVGLILSALYIYFRDTQYLYDIFTHLLMYLSAIFYPVDRFPYWAQQLFLLNPVFTHIQYFRLVVIQGVTPSLNVHLILLLYSCTALFIGSVVYKKRHRQFVYHI